MPRLPHGMIINPETVRLSEFLAETTVLSRAGCKVPGHALAGSLAQRDLSHSTRRAPDEM
jgi:hypothetical protein